jgi:transposase
VGIDVAKDTLDLACSDTPGVLTVPNDPAGFAAILEHLQERHVELVVIESTGGLEKKLIATLLENTLPVTLVQPARVRHFAQAKGQLAKTDALDAALLVRFGQSLLHDAADSGEPVRQVAKKPGKQQLLSDLITARRQLVEARAVLYQQTQSTRAKPAAKALEKVIAATTKQIADLDAQIATLIEEDQSQGGLGKTAAILRSVPGIGPVMAAVLLARMPELGKVSRGTAASLLGVAPLADDSGPRKGQRHIRGGRQDVRNVLYMSAVSAIGCNPYIRPFAQRLLAAGKVFKKVATACMRKLVVLLNAMVRDGTEFKAPQAPVAA